MSLRDRDRRSTSFEVDEGVRRILADWSKERDSDVGRVHLRRAAARLPPEKRRQLVERLAEISLGLLFVIELTEP